MLTSLTVENYKSLKKVEIPLSNFVALVGPNNSGKSNILDCFTFIKDLTLYGNSALTNRGGASNIVWSGEITLPISFRFEGVSTEYPNVKYSYFIKINPLPNDSYSITEERFQLSKIDLSENSGLPLHGIDAEKFEAGKKNTVIINRGGNSPLVLTANLSSQIGSMSYNPDATLLKVPQPNTLVFDEFRSAILNWSLYSPIPSNMLQSVAIKKETELNEDGGNLSGLMHTIHSEYPDRFKEIEDLFQRGIPEAEQLFSHLTEGGHTYIAMKEGSLSARTPSWSLSSGTLRLLAYLAVIYSPDAPPIVGFEEPENFLHPHLANFMVDILKQRRTNQQTLICTHSPYIVKALDREDLLVVEKQEGQTMVKSVSEHKGIKKSLETLDLGELWYSGEIGGNPA